MNRDDYIAEAEKQLGDTTVYKKFICDPTKEFKRDIDILLQDTVLQGTITIGLQKALENENPVVPILYLVPKVHKSLTHPPGRPIISEIGFIFQPLAVYVNSFLQDIIKKLPHCLKDTNIFLRRVENIDVHEVTWLCTYDVKSLYTNIPLQEEMEAVY